MPEHLRRAAIVLVALTFALTGCTEQPVTITSTRTPDAAPTATMTPAEESSDPLAGGGAEELSFASSELEGSPPYAIPEITADELTRVLIDSGTPQSLPAASPPPDVAGFKIIGACEPIAGVPDAALIVTPSDASGPFTRFTITCNGAQHIARIGSATPLTPPYELTVENPDTADDGYAQLLQDNADGTS